MNKSNEELIGETRGAAISILEDYDTLIEVSKNYQTKPANARHSSAILRRWLIEGALRRVASPRVGRVQIRAIDNTPIYRAERLGGLVQFVSGGAVIHGVFIAAGALNSGDRPLNFEGYDPETLIDMGIDTFNKQRVIYSNSTWLTRAEVINL